MQRVGVDDLGDRVVGAAAHVHVHVHVPVVIDRTLAGAIGAGAGRRSVRQVEQVEAGRVGALRLPQGPLLPPGLVGSADHLLGQLGGDGGGDGGRVVVVGTGSAAEGVHPDPDGLLVRFQRPGGPSRPVAQGPDVVERRGQPPGRRDVPAPVVPAPGILWGGGEGGGGGGRTTQPRVRRGRSRRRTQTLPATATAERPLQRRDGVEARRRQRRRTRRHVLHSLRQRADGGGEGHVLGTVFGGEDILTMSAFRTQSGSQDDFFFLRLEKAGAHAVFNKLRSYVQQHASTKKAIGSLLIDGRGAPCRWVGSRKEGMIDPMR